MAQQGHHGLDTTNTKQLLLGLAPTANVTRATRVSLAPAYDTCAKSAHWHKAKMRMHIPSFNV